MKRMIATSSTLVVLVVPAVAQADIRTEANHLRVEVAHHFGPRAPGRDIVKQGFWTGRRARPASPTELRGYVAALRRMLAPPPRVSTAIRTAGAVLANPYTPAVASVTAPSGTVTCILQRESTNGQTSSNIAQFQQSTWVANGGTRYAPTPGQASRAEQIAMVDQVLAKPGGIDNWRPYDGCGG